MFPFHPWCFGVYTQLSKRQRGKVRLNKLAAFFENPSWEWDFFCDDTGIPEGSDADDWCHNAGDEWLAANPYHVPKLRDLLTEASTTGPSFKPQAGAFDSPIVRRDTSRDIFARLAQDIHIEVLRHLDSTDIANLRLASRTFSQLPISLWYRLLMDEMPWLWELWTSDMPYFWATVTEKDILAHKVVDTAPPSHIYHSERIVVIGHRIDVADRQAKWAIPKPPRYGTNWYMLYTGIKHHWDELKGLQNRRRIWKHLEKLIVDMDRYIDVE